jgi:amino acid permease
VEFISATIETNGMNEIDSLDWDREARSGMEMHSRAVAKDNAIAQVSEVEDTVQPSSSNGDRDLMFKARHIQMMALGSLLLYLTDCRFGNGK